MDILECYKMLQVRPDAKGEEITASFRKLAMRYHPDRNRDRVDQATSIMTQLNVAYTTIISHRFENEQVPAEEPDRGPTPPRPEPDAPGSRNQNRKPQKPQPAATAGENTDEIEKEIYITRFIKIRETAKEALYRFFQYNLQNLARRDELANIRIFNEIVQTLRKCYHAINTLSKKTGDQDLLHHFAVFKAMLLEFYRASECLTINDSYASQYEVDAYRLYRKGDEALHQGHKEIFYDRHNRGSFKSHLAYSSILDAVQLFTAALRLYPKSSWNVELGIKLAYAESLKKYMELFFMEE